MGCAPEAPEAQTPPDPVTSNGLKPWTVDDLNEAVRKVQDAETPRFDEWYWPRPVPP